MKRFILPLLIFCLPFQLGLHFWPSWSYVSGFRIDYLSPTLYLTDLLILLYLLTALRHRPPYLLLFLFFAPFNILISLSPLIALSSFLHWLLYYLLFVTLLKEDNLLAKIKTPLLLSASLIIFLEIAQLLNQASIGGPFYYLGERTFNFGSPNIAKLGPLVRPYSTFSHPNSLAGYLLMVSLIIPRFRKLIYLGVLFTFSKAAVLALLFLHLPRLCKPIMITSLLISLTPLIFNFFPVPFIPSSSLLSRLYMGPLDFKLLSQHLLLGVGLNNYILALSNVLPPSHQILSSLQPIHSVPLLIATELGVPGIILMFYLFQKFLTLNSKFLILLAITASVDHYWWTLPQNKLILVLILAILITENHKNSKF